MRRRRHLRLNHSRATPPASRRGGAAGRAAPSSTPRPRLRCCSLQHKQQSSKTQQAEHRPVHSLEESDHSLSRSFFFMRLRRRSIDATSDLRER